MKNFTRRRFLQTAAAGSLALASGSCWKREPRRRNVLFIAIDDLNGWIGPLKTYRGKVLTPHLSRLAKSGMLFSQAYCSSPWCNPSRSSLMTGLSPATCGIRSNTENFRDFLPDVQTLPQYFSAHGYATAGSGKVFHNRFPDLRSWDEFFETPQRRQPEGRPLNGRMKWRQFRQLSTSEKLIDWGPVDYGAESMGDYKVADWAISYLDRAPQRGGKEGQPFFLGVGFAAPHMPWYIPRPFFDLYPESEIILPIVKKDDLNDLGKIAHRWVERARERFLVPDLTTWRQLLQAYLAAISFADAQLGRLLDAWNASPHSKDSVVMLWSDHGFHLGEKGHFRKGTLWEESLRVPLIVSAPEVTAGLRCEWPVSLLDLYPTLLDLCGLPQRPDLEGESFMPQLRAPKTFRVRPAFSSIYIHHRSVRSRRYRYIRYSNNEEELYDHRIDPNEWRNLAGDPAFEELRRQHRLWLFAPDRARKKALKRHRQELESKA